MSWTPPRAGWPQILPATAWGGDTALVQLPNVAEFYLVFFALLKAGIAPVNALFSHNRLELLSYAEQITRASLSAR